MKNRIKIMAALMLLALNLSAQTGSRRASQFNLENKTGLHGYDPVAYIVQKKAIKGKKEFSVAYKGVTYNFATAEDKEMFIKNPLSYEPQYGGWCAYAMGATGEKVDVDPETFKVVDGKLYLFYNAYFNNTLKTWNKDELKLRKNADENWKKI